MSNATLAALGEQDDPNLFVGKHLPLKFETAFKITKGVELDLGEHPYDALRSSGVRIRLVDGFIGPPNTVDMASVRFDHSTLIEIGKKILPHIPITDADVVTRAVAIKNLEAGHKFASAESLGEYWLRLRLGMKLTRLDPKESIPALFGYGLGGVFVYYRLGVPDPWRYCAMPVKRIFRGAVQVIDRLGGTTAEVQSVDRVLWLSATLGNPDLLNPPDECLIISDYVIAGTEARLSGEAIE